jgi:3-deoxy-D-manno-octulosonic-acid transferase
MAYLLDAVYLLVLLLLSPWILYKTLTTGKSRRGLWRKIRGDALVRGGGAPCAWFHGVSVGEIHLLGTIVRGLRERHPDWQCAVSTSTDTGFDEACKRFSDLPVFFWPFDFSWAVRRALRRVNPSLVVLAEGELWPNFLRAAKERGVLTAVVNGRMSPRSRQKLLRFRPLTRRLVAGVDLFLAQNEEYADGYRAVGASPERVQVTGSVKYDGVQSDRRNPKTRELARLLNIVPGDLVWIAGSTQDPEEKHVLAIYRALRQRWPDLRLILVPRQKERFAEVADLLRSQRESFVRRSELTGPLADRSAIVLVDTIGELASLWGLADVAYVGGSLDGRRGGQNMIEPAAYGAAVVFGPHVWNFRETADRLIGLGAAIQVSDSAALELSIRKLLENPTERAQLGAAARLFVKDQQGATERTLAHIDVLLARNREQSKAA